MAARWQDAMFERNRQIQFLESPTGQRYMARVEAQMRQKEYEDDKFGDLPEGIIWRTAYETVKQADPIYIHEHVVEVIDHARDSFLPEIVLPTDPFCAVGFAWLARSMSILDVHNKRTPVRAIGWLPIRANDEDGMERGGLWITMWAHFEDEEEYSDYPLTVKENHAENPHGSLAAIHSFFLDFNRRQWEQIGSNGNGNSRDDAYMEASIRQWTTVQVMWRLGQQLVQTGQQAPRPARKESKRLGAAKDTGVTVITLRREREPSAFEYEDGDGGKYYHVQFMVRGHWRNQWYPSLKQHRQKWISSYWKGDPDDPIRFTERVFDFKR